MYIIDRKTAELIGRFQIDTNAFFDPFSCEQKDGTFLIGEILISNLMHYDKINQIDWAKIPKTNYFNNKNTNFPT